MPTQEEEDTHGKIPQLWTMMVKRIESTDMKPGPSEMTFPDHFSDHADRYEAYRPLTPAPCSPTSLYFARP